MGRIFGIIRVDGRECRTLFDSGARNTYIVSEAAEGLLRARLIEVDAYVLGEIGVDDDGRPIDILFGALAMQKWGIRLLPEGERLDLSRYPEEFTEFAG